MKLGQISTANKVTGGAAVVLIGAGVGIGLAISGGGHSMPAKTVQPVLVAPAADTSSVPATPAVMPSPSRLPAPPASTVVVKPKPKQAVVEQGPPATSSDPEPTVTDPQPTQQNNDVQPNDPSTAAAPPVVAADPTTQDAPPATDPADDPGNQPGAPSGPKTLPSIARDPVVPPASAGNPASPSSES